MLWLTRNGIGDGRPVSDARLPPGSLTSGRHGHDQGSVTLWVLLVVVPVGFLLLGLVVDGGRAMSVRADAADVAEQAARAGADAISDTSLRNATSPSQIRIDSVEANRQAQQVIALADAHGEVSVASTEVTVTTRITRPTALLTIVGIRSVTGASTATATVLHGTTDETPHTGIESTRRPRP
jgi:Flp pilus assembly protein TadG